MNQGSEVPGAGSAPQARLKVLLQAEQVRLVAQQIPRVALPHACVDACVAGVAWLSGLRAGALFWFVGMELLLVLRTYFLGRLIGNVQMPARQRLLRHSQWQMVLGVHQAVLIALVFAQPKGPAQYILTMIFVGNAAGAVATVAGDLKSYLAWSSVFGAPLALAWFTQGTLEGAAVGALVLLLFGVLSGHVRDQGLALLKLVSLSDSLRHERDRAERASEAKTRFFAAASHDLRQPLTALAYNAATVQALAQRDGDVTLGRVSQGIARALTESRGLLDSLLEVSELDAGAVRVDWQLVDVGAAVAEVCAGFEPLAQERGLSLVFVPAGHPELWARTDVALFKRILQNLIGNALKFTEHGGVVCRAEPCLLPDGEYVRVTVRDTGPGIPAAAHEQVFEEFYQLGNLERNRSKGLGLGLAIVRRLSQLMAVSVSLDSEAGQGAAFHLSLARLPAPNAVTMHTEAAANLWAPIGGARVLVLDDEAEIRESLSTLLGTLGWQVCAVADQAQALAALREGFAPDVLLLDFRLRGGENGLDALAAMHLLGVQAPAVLLTGDTAPARIQAAHAAGLPVLYKPVDGQLLVAQMQRVVAQARSTKDAA